MQDEKDKKPRKENIYLSAEVIKKMLYRFLVENKMTKENLAKALEITITELEKLLFCEAAPALIAKVNLPLIKLYCETKFDSGQKERVGA